MTRNAHLARFYVDDQTLVESVAEYVIRGVREGAAIVIATEHHVRSLEDRWATLQFDAVAHRQSGRLIQLDAAETLAAFLVGDTPDRTRFLATVGDVVAKATQQYGSVTAFGEMVNLLWRQGKATAAIELESLWNELGERHHFSLYYGYSLNDGAAEGNDPAFEAVCNAHQHVIPAESYPTSAPRERSSTIAHLQRKALILEARLEREQELQRSLRETHAQLQARSQELTRFNDAAVGRESWILELKREVNELRASRGEPPRYNLHENPALIRGVRIPYSAPSDAEQTLGPRSEGLIPLDSILMTDRLRERTSRPPDYAAENGALGALVQALAESPRTILQCLAEKVLEVLHAGSAGMSLLTLDGERFYWGAIAGQWAPHLGGGTPREFGPCGDVLDRNSALLFTHWERRYPYLATATPLAEEGLLVPFYVAGKAVGTIWAIAHDPAHKFDAEDLRLLESLGRFASAAYQAVELAGAVEERRAALSLLEDAVQSRALAEDSLRKLRESEKTSCARGGRAHETQ